MAVVIEAEPFVTALRERLALKLENHMNVPEVLAAFDRATTEAVFSSLNGQREKELTPAQRGGLTRKRQNAERKAALKAEGEANRKRVEESV